MKTPDEIIAPGLAKLAELRPQSFQHLNYRTGVYWHILAGQRACVARALSRVAELLAANRLSTTGQDLIDYVNSEFTEILGSDLDGNLATGEIVLTRPALTDTGTPAPLLAGNIPKGQRFIRPANLTALVPFENAEYVTIADYHFVAGQTVSAPIPIEAVRTGATYNHPVTTNPVAHGVTNSGAPLFDTTLKVTGFSAGGGSDAFGSAVNFQPLNADDANEFVRRFARAYSKGQYAPTDKAAIYGALRGTGARHVITYDDPAKSILKVQIADGAWASSDRWARLVQQSIYDANLVGFGCVVNVVGTRNKVISATANVTLRDWNYTTDTAEIDDAIRTAVADYFNDRPDWNIWKSRALKNAVTRAHKKILKCSSITVFDEYGAVLSEIASPNYTQEQFHYYLPSKAVTITYVGPG